jgi:hypothetical protein
MKLKYYGFGVAILTLAVGVGCGGEIVGGNNHEAPKDAGQDVAVVDTGNPTGHVDAGGPVDTGPPDTGRDVAPPDAGPDHGTPSTTYPAFMPFMPPVLNHMGPVLTAPQIVTISWTDDPLHGTWEAFDDAIGSSSYWSTSTAEYGVGPAVSGASNHIEMTTADPTSWTDTDIITFVSNNAADTATSGWPAPNPNILYTIWLPPSTASTFALHNGGGLQQACGGGGGIIGGYHDSVNVSGIGNVTYAVVIQCDKSMATTFASHELAEASTDPNPESEPAYVGLDDKTYYAWDFFQAGSGTEIGDMCEVYFDSDYTDPTLGYGVQRLWSNKSATGGHAPCVPAESGPYYNVTPLDMEPLTVNAGAIGGTAVSPAMGYVIPVGKSKTFPVGFYSDGPTSGPWTIKARDWGDPYDGYLFMAKTPSAVTVSTDISQGENGQVAYVTVTVNSLDETNSDLIVIESSLPGSNCGFGPCRHSMPILISSK